ncbi:dimethylallyltransferase [Pontibacillus halophilus JSM 076056 = DSM 19796]|uniref:Dimethylallyltransferase n=1 Tax=Pontibacillus halophilus JSM 076056 = DSM 19796 TaxID=1385510 RepID=A0A0A5GD51_9BACI|nr:type 1 glutamine amidotransferase domain-containing protein [Pontibacillus halophilus]KGX91141.1 dimethylallyltransferase [Pontibacillus halophilus JSM 076056 = DSM 19796]
MAKHVLMVVTNHSELAEGIQTGVWLSEFAEAYNEFKANNFNVTVASPSGGLAPVDPGSVDESTPQELLERKAMLEQTVSLNNIDASTYDAIFLPGGHGTMFDLPKSEKLKEVLQDLFERGKPVAAVCHGPAGLVEAKLSNGQPLVAGRKVNAFTNPEEADTTLDKHMPFLLETKLRELGAIYVAAPNWNAHVEVDGNLITGQNPQSTMAVANEFVKQLQD